MKVVRLEVEQHDWDHRLPVGSLFRVTTNGKPFQFTRRSRRETDEHGVGKQTWWVKTT